MASEIMKKNLKDKIIVTIINLKVKVMIYMKKKEKLIILII